MNNIIRCILLILVIGAASVPASAKRSTLKLNEHPQTGLNARDYVLQKPLPYDTFPSGQRGFGKHFFIGGGLGVFTITSDNMYHTPGLNGSFQVGSWFNPVNGMRLQFNGGSPSLHSGPGRYLMGSAQLDYLLNVTNLLRGYDPKRKFELIFTAGLEADLLRHNGVWRKMAGAGAGMQLRFYNTNSAYFFIEPRLALLVGSGYASSSTYRLKLEPSLSFGLGYQFNRRQHSFTDGMERYSQRGDDNLFFGVTGGGWAALSDPKGVRLTAGAYVGKMLSSVSGLQLNAAIGEKRNVVNNHRYFTIGTLDYVLNIDKVPGVYNKHSLFSLQGNVGVGGAVLFYKGQQYTSPALGLGLTGMLNLSPNWAFTLRPHAYVMGRQFFNKLGADGPVIASVDIGLRYTIGDFSHRFPNSYDKLFADKRWFITFGGGYARRMRYSNGIGGDIFMGFGRRFTPVSSYRIMVAGTLFPKTPGVMDMTLDLDYLSSLTTAMLGYNPDRVFDMQLVLGVRGGWGNYRGPSQIVYGAKAGLQANFRLTEHLDLFLEPELQVGRQPSPKATSTIPELRLNIGLNYRLGTYADFRDKLAEKFTGDGRNFAGFAFGPATYTGSGNSKGMALTGAFDLNVGRWFSRVSGLRLVLSNDIVRYNRLAYLGAAHVDYMLNISSLIDRRPERKVHVIGALGAGIGYSHNGRKPFGGSVYGGLQLRYNLPYNIDIHFEPGAQVWQKNILPRDVCATHDYTVGARVMFGASYRF